MSPEKRRLEALALVRSGQKMLVEDLASALGASRETIRRDLAELDRRGLLRKIHGGAVVAEPGVDAFSLEGPFADRVALNVAAKRAIARAAARLFQPGDSLFIDTGSTTILFAEELASKPGLTVITNSATIATLVAKAPDSKVFLLGGEFRRGGQESVGDLTSHQIGQFRPGHAVLTVAAVSGNGYMDHDFQEAQVARAMARQAASVTVLADATKIGLRAVCELGPLTMAARLVTDAAPASLADALADAEVDVLVAD